jgi:D-alanine-D-alanine ligase
LAIPAFHGLYGEDGRIQGLLETAGVPYSGMRTLASSVFMDKIATKRILAGTRIEQLPYWSIKRPQHGLLITPDELLRSMSDAIFPCCVKPAHLGSSIGVARADDWKQISDVLSSIFRVDDTAILEPFVTNLEEYSISVCRFDGHVRTSAIERPRHTSKLLDFKAKYLFGGSKGHSGQLPHHTSEGMLSLTREINPKIPSAQEARIREWAIEAFRTVEGTGAPRIDFLSDSVSGQIWLNEVNPCPGSFAYFLWEAAEKPILFSRLIELLIEEGFAQNQATRLSPDLAPEEARLFKRN